MSEGQDDTGDGGAEAGGQAGTQAGGGQPQQAYRRGPGIGDIFSIPETKNEMKIGLALNVLLSVGLAFVALGLSTMQTGFGGGFGGVVGGGLAFTGPLLLAPLIGVVIGLRQADVLEDQPGNILYANALVTTVVGTFLLMLISMILGSIIAGGAGNIGQAIGQMLLPFLISAIGAGLVAAGAVWVDTNVVPGPARPAQPQAGQGQAP